MEDETELWPGAAHNDFPGCRQSRRRRHNQSSAATLSIPALLLHRRLLHRFRPHQSGLNSATPPLLQSPRHFARLVESYLHPELPFPRQRNLLPLICDSRRRIRGKGEKGAGR